MIETITKAWSWIGLFPAEVTASNAFGNVIVRAVDGAYWRICPEELSCKLIARSQDEYEQVFLDTDFISDWELSHVVAIARAKLGPLTLGRCYCLKTPAVFGGRYEEGNLGTISRLELIDFSGDLAEQIKDFPDGAKVKINIVR